MISCILELEEFPLHTSSHQLLVTAFALSQSGDVAMDTGFFSFCDTVLITCDCDVRDVVV